MGVVEGQRASICVSPADVCISNGGRPSLPLPQLPDADRPDHLGAGITLSYQLLQRPARSLQSIQRGLLL